MSGTIIISSNVFNGLIHMKQLTETTKNKEYGQCNCNCHTITAITSFYWDSNIGIRTNSFGLQEDDV